MERFNILMTPKMYKFNAGKSKLSINNSKCLRNS